MKKLLGSMLVAGMALSMFTGMTAYADDYDLTFYCIDTTDPDFDTWLQTVEEGTGLKINVVAAPTDSDTRQQKVTTILSTGDTSVDVLFVNDEMISSFKNTGWLEPIQDTVLTEDIRGEYAQGYIEHMVTSVDGDIVALPSYTGYLAFWVNQKFLDEAGIEEIVTKEDFEKYLAAVSKDGKYGYGGSWEKTYVFNEIGSFVNMFGGDYFDWTNPGNKEAMQFLHDMAANGYTPLDQLADKYEQMTPKCTDETYGSWFMWGIGGDYKAAGMLSPDQIHMQMIPDLDGDGNRTIYTDSWSYVLNKASENKEAAIKFMQFMTTEEGMKANFECFDRMPPRKDLLDNIVPDGHDAKEMYARFANECYVTGRPMVPQAMEFITDMGTLFQSMIKDEVTVDEMCEKAQELVVKYTD